MQTCLYAQGKNGDGWENIAEKTDNKSQGRAYALRSLFLCCFFCFGGFIIRDRGIRERGERRKIHLVKLHITPIFIFLSLFFVHFSLQFCFPRNHHERESQRYQRAQRQTQKGLFQFLFFNFFEWSIEMLILADHDFVPCFG